MEGVPAGYEIKYIAENLEKHFYFLSAINEDQVMITLHAKIDLDHVNNVTLSEIKQYLLDVHKIQHVTLRLESQIGTNSIKEMLIKAQLMLKEGAVVVLIAGNFC